MTSQTSQLKELVGHITSADATIAIAESLTGGQLSSTFAAAPDASEWLRGGVVAYASDVKFAVLDVTPGPVVKFAVLDVTPGPVVTADCAAQMAAGVAELLEATVGIGVTGVGGPDPEEGHPAGTVFAAVSMRGETSVREWHFDGSPDEVLQQTIDAVIGLALTVVTSSAEVSVAEGEIS